MRGLVGLLLTAAAAAAQVTPAANTATQPGSNGWPPQASPSVPPPLPGGAVTRELRTPGDPVPAYPGPTATLIDAPTAADLGTAPAGPLPGSLADEFAREYEQKQRHRTCDYMGNRYTLFPNSLLWAPPLADKQAPRLAVAYADDKRFTGDLIDATLGHTLGLVRIDREGLDGSIQLDLFGVAITRFSGADLVATDVRWGVPLTFRRGEWFSRVAYEYTSSHLGNRPVAANALPAVFGGRYQKDEVVVGVGRWFGDTFRAYGQAAYAFGFTDDRPRLDDSSKRKQRYQLGAEWFPSGLFNSGWGGQPFVAVNADFRGENDFETDLTAQAGWLWRNPLARLASVRIYGEYTRARPAFGLFRGLDRDTGYGFGVAADY